ncbi:hypothetical protein ACEQPO_10330 [Bacillus sp. SL00103]
MISNQRILNVRNRSKDIMRAVNRREMSVYDNPFNFITLTIKRRYKDIETVLYEQEVETFAKK